VTDQRTVDPAIVAYVRARAEDYRLSSPQTCSNMYSLARELEGDPVAWRPRHIWSEDD
jgi:hypothetical protein